MDLIVACVAAQFTTAKGAIEGGRDAEARAQLDEAVVLEVGEVRDSTSALLALP